MISHRRRSTKSNQVEFPKEPDGNLMADTQEDGRTRIELALYKSEERFRQVVESAPSAMVMIRDDGRIEMVNAQTERLFGYSRDELLGASVEILVPYRFRRQHPGLRGTYFLNP